MIINKYTPRRKAILWLQRHFPLAKRIKNIAPRFKEGKYRARIKRHAEEYDDAMARTGQPPLFTHVEIETINRCNGECGFCPVNRHQDPRKPMKMEESLFHAVIDELKSLDYSGMVHLYSNNEPLLDTRIFAFAQAARQALPKARIHCYTNALLLDLDKYKRLIEHLDVLTINNYCRDFRFHPNVQEIIDYAAANPELDRKTFATMRYLGEIMTSRGGQSPNKQEILTKTKPFGCILPVFQLIIRPDGNVSLCCNDAIGTVTLGNVGESGVEGVWRNKDFQSLRRRVLDSRECFPICRQCDTMIGK